MEQTQINSFQEVYNAKEEGFEKRKGEMHFGCWQQKEVAGPSFNN